MRGGSTVEFSATVELPMVRDRQGRFTRETAEVEVTVKASVTPPTRPTLRADPDDCDPGDPGDFDLLSVVRDDTGEDVTKLVDATQFEERGLDQAEYDAEAAYDDAMEARAEARREREEEGW